MANKEIAATELFRRFLDVTGLEPDADLKKPIGSILKGNAKPWDLALLFMETEPFKSDGLTLHKKNVAKAKTIAAFGDLIFQWYIDDGWTITGLSHA